MLMFLALTWASTTATYGLDASDGTVVWDAQGTAHGCLEGPHQRVGGVVDGGVELRGGQLVLPVQVADPG